jgi:hypothetical protein
MIVFADIVAGSPLLRHYRRYRSRYLLGYCSTCYCRSHRSEGLAVSIINHMGLLDYSPIIVRAHWSRNSCIRQRKLPRSPSVSPQSSAQRFVLKSDNIQVLRRDVHCRSLMSMATQGLESWSDGKTSSHRDQRVVQPYNRQRHFQ